MTSQSKKKLQVSTCVRRRHWHVSHALTCFGKVCHHAFHQQILQYIGAPVVVSGGVRDVPWWNRWRNTRVGFDELFGNFH